MPPKKPLVENMTDAMWLAAHHLEDVDPTFSDLIADCMRNIKITLGAFNVVSFTSVFRLPPGAYVHGGMMMRHVAVPDSDWRSLLATQVVLRTSIYLHFTNSINVPIKLFHSQQRLIGLLRATIRFPYLSASPIKLMDHIING